MQHFQQPQNLGGPQDYAWSLWMAWCSCCSAALGGTHSGICGQPWVFVDFSWACSHIKGLSWACMILPHCVAVFSSSRQTCVCFHGESRAARAKPSCAIQQAASEREWVLSQPLLAFPVLTSHWPEEVRVGGATVPQAKAGWTQESHSLSWFMWWVWHKCWRMIFFHILFKSESK